MNDEDESPAITITANFQVRSGLPELKSYVEFYNSHPILKFPHRNPLAKQEIEQVTISCDGCSGYIPHTLVRGVINDYAAHTEVRFVAPCRKCVRLVHNVLRFTTDSELVFMSDGEWMRTVAPRWRKLLRRVPILGPLV